MASPAPSWSWLDRRQERDVRELVRLVAGVHDEADPNFQLALHFAWSNFRCGRGTGAGDGKGTGEVWGAWRDRQSPSSPCSSSCLVTSRLLGPRRGDTRKLKQWVVGCWGSSSRLRSAPLGKGSVCPVPCPAHCA